MSALLAERTISIAGRSRLPRWMSQVCDFSAASGCGQVLLSPGARLLRRVPYAFLGAGFYATVLAMGVCGLLVPSLRGSASWLVAGLFGGSLVAAAGLVRLQARVIRAWCPWCMGCHVANLLAFVAALCAALAGDIGNAGAWCVLAILGLGTFAASVSGFLWRESSGDAERAKAALSNLADDPILVHAAVEATSPMPIESEEGDWWLGQEGPEVVVYANPFCPHCAEFDREAREALTLAGSGRLAIRLFPVGSPAEQDLSTILYAIGETEGAEAYYRALERVFVDPSSFRGLTIDGALEVLSEDSEATGTQVQAGRARLLAHARAARRNGIVRTPFAFLDGRPLPAWASAKARVAEIARQVKRTPIATFA